MRCCRFSFWVQNKFKLTLDKYKHTTLIFSEVVKIITAMCTYMKRRSIGKRLDACAFYANVESVLAYSTDTMSRLPFIYRIIDLLHQKGVSSAAVEKILNSPDFKAQNNNSDNESSFFGIDKNSIKSCIRR